MTGAKVGLQLGTFQQAGLKLHLDWSVKRKRDFRPEFVQCHYGRTFLDFIHKLHDFPWRHNQLVLWFWQEDKGKVLWWAFYMNLRYPLGFFELRLFKPLLTWPHVLYSFSNGIFKLQMLCMSIVQVDLDSIKDAWSLGLMVILN